MNNKQVAELRATKDTTICTDNNKTTENCHNFRELQAKTNKKGKVIFSVPKTIIEPPTVELNNNPTIPNWRSVSSGPKINVTFTNRTDSVLSYYWIDYGGNLQLKKVLKPGESKKTHTYRTHPWVIKKKPENVVIASFRAKKNWKGKVYSVVTMNNKISRKSNGNWCMNRMKKK